MDSVCGVEGGTAVPDREGYCDVCGNTWRHCQQLLAGELLMCTCPRDPDDYDDPGDPLSTCPVHGWE